MKAGTLLLVGGAAALVYAVTRPHAAPASPAGPAPGPTPGPTPAPAPPMAGPPAIAANTSGWSVLDWSKIADPNVKASPMGAQVPANGFVTSDAIAGLLSVSPDLAAASAGTLGPWIVAMRNAGHRVFESAAMTDPSGSVGYVLMLDQALPGYNEVSA